MLSSSGKEIFFWGFILGIFIYYTFRYIINKKTSLELPIILERYYDDPLKTLVQAVLTVISLALGNGLAYLISLFL